MNSIPCDDLDEAIDHYTKQLGYRLDMIKPADAPREALLSKDGETIRLVIENHPVGEAPPPLLRKEGSWIKGRAGMEYRDLIPDRLGGKVIASHIRLTEGGEVPDYVHYHKVDFQMIYCKKGRIKVVYEDQGPPFWLETGDCVLQPPEIRHRVLECTAGAEVIEVSMPAEHETWVEHEITLPTNELKPARDFGRQRFLRHIAAHAEWKQSEFDGFKERETGIYEATDGLAEAYIIRSRQETVTATRGPEQALLSFYFVLDGGVVIELDPLRHYAFTAGDVFTVSPDDEFLLRSESATEILHITV